jgi:ATP-dependent Lon protease
VSDYEQLFVFASDWSLPPMDWREPLAARLAQRFPALVEPELNPRRITARPVPFYPDHDLVRVSGFDRRTHYPAYFLLGRRDGALTHLDGSAPPIHALNAAGALQLNDVNYRQYLMFFCLFVHGDEGAFLVLDTIDNAALRRLRASFDEAERAPMHARRGSDGQWEVEAGVIYGQQLFRASFRIWPSGMVEMVDDTPLREIARAQYRPRRFPDLYATGNTTAKVPEHGRGDSATPAHANDTVRFIDIADLEEQHKASASDTARLGVLQRYLDVLRQNDGRLPLYSAGSTATSLAALRQRYPNFGELIDFVADEMTLATLLKRGHVRLPPCIVEGEPGIGKTRFLHDLAAALQIHLETLDMASATAGFELSGSSSVWRGGRPGLLLDAVVRCGHANPMFLLDELDKVSRQDSSPLEGPLHAMLEHVTARRFRDEYLKVRADLSHVNWIATCNDVGLLSRPIRSRFVLFRVRPPTAHELPVVIRTVYSDVLTEQGIAHAFAAELPDTVVRHLANHGAEPRSLRILLRRAIVAATVRSHRQNPDRPLRDIRVHLFDLPDAALTHVRESDGNRYLM